MFIVKRPFRNYGKVLTAGSLVDPATTKLFKNRLGEGKIIEVNEHNYDNMYKYFANKHHVTLPSLDGTEKSAEGPSKLFDKPANEPKTPVKTPASAKPVASVKPNN